MIFEERCAQMGLENIGNGNFFYSDQYADVVYSYLHANPVATPQIVLRERDIAFLGLFTRPSVTTREEDLEFKHAAIVSDLYKFEGHDVINNAVRGSIAEIGTPILREEALLSDDKAVMLNTMIIQNPTNTPQEGDVYPQIVVANSYNGTRCKSISFGINIATERRTINFSFATTLGTLKQIHHQNHGTSMVSPIGTFIDRFAGDISQLITENFSNVLSDEDVMNTLDLIEKVGKRRRNEVSKYLQDLDSNMTTWNMFLAIAKFSSDERNINAKRMMEDIAERVLVVPQQMLDHLRVSNGN